MELIIENKRLGERHSLEVSDEFMQDFADISIIAGFTRYELKDTTTDEEKMRVDMSQQFGIENYPELAEKYPQYRTSATKDIQTAIENDIDSRLVGKWERLGKDPQRKHLVTLLANGLKMWMQAKHKTDTINDEIKRTIHDNDVYIDYAFRLRDLCRDSSCMEDFNTTRNEIWEMQIQDDRNGVWWGILDGIDQPFREIVTNAAKELSEIGDGKKRLEDSPLWLDTEYWKSMIAAADADSRSEAEASRVIEFLKAARESCESDKSDNVFQYYLDLLINIYKPVYDILESLSKMDREKNLEGFDGAIRKVNEYFEQYRDNILTAVYRFHYDTREMSPEETRIIDLEMETIYGTMMSKSNGLRQYITMMQYHYPVLYYLKKGMLDPVKLVHQEYTQEMLKEIIGE